MNNYLTLTNQELADKFECSIAPIKKFLNQNGLKREWKIELLDNEIPREIEGFSKYIVTNLGRIFKKENGRLITIRPNRKGYMVCSLIPDIRDGLRDKKVSVHRIIAKAFIPNVENKEQVNHIDGDRTNNKIENLEWCTSFENMKHRHKSGICSSEQSSFATITDEIAKNICVLLSREMNPLEISQELGVSINIVRQIKYRQRWTYISKDYDWFIDHSKYHQRIS